MGAEPTSCDNERPPTTGHHQLLAGIPTRSGRSFCKWDWNQLMMFEIATMTRLSMFNPNVPPNQTFPPNWSSSETPMPWKHHWIFMDTGFFWVVSSCFIHLFDGYIGYIGYIPTSLHRAIGQWWPMRWWVASLGAVLGLNKEEAPWPWEWRQPNSSAVDWWYGVILWYIYIFWHWDFEGFYPKTGNSATFHPGKWGFKQ